MNLTVAPPKIALQPHIAIVIPVFKHSVLVSEAISCALAQKTEFPIVTIVVNDGCKFTETDTVCREFALAHPEQVYYLYRRNGGLSAARNTGIDFSLNTWSSIKAVYLLDADNRISPYTIDQVFRMLMDYPDIGWVYPTINMFGQEDNGEYRGEYSVLRHLRFNTCEAGSMIRREVFEAGCRYDEAMKLGFEDWEFWWQAIDAGFRGKHCPEFGFQYRKRPESMLKNSERDSEGIIHYMQRKHRDLFKHRTILHLEDQEAPRYAIFLSDTGKVALTSDPTCLDRQISLNEYRILYQRAKLTPLRYHRPHFLVFTRSDILNILDQSGLVRWVFWRLELTQEKYNFAGVNLNLDSQQEAIFIHENDPEFCLNPGETDHLVMTTVDMIDTCLKDTDDSWIQSVLTPNPMSKIFSLWLDLPESADSEITIGGEFYRLLYVFKRLRHTFSHQQVQPQWNWHFTHFPPRNAMYLDTRLVLETGAVYPIITDSKQKHVGFVLSILEFGGVEKVALNIAKAFKDANWEVHLFILGSRMQQLPEWAQVFTTINFYHDSKMAPWQGSLYLGSKCDAWSDVHSQFTAKGLLSWLDVAINFHCATANSLMGIIKRAGVKTVASLHVHDLSPWQRAAGHGYLTLGYEHAYDLMIPCSHQMADWCHSLGVPENKVVVVPNACGYPMEDEQVNQILSRRWQHQDSQELRVLFIGRFDRQKGLDRLLGVITESRNRKLPIQWRLVGKNIIKGEDAGSELKAVADLIEPPALTPEAINQIYEWADVLLLPSYWEGLPLTVLEAMRLGVVVCASNVGAMEEAVEDGQTGFLIPSLIGDAYVEAVIKVLTKLIDEPKEVIRVSQAAARIAAKRSWEKACAELMKMLSVSQSK